MKNMNVPPMTAKTTPNTFAGLLTLEGKKLAVESLDGEVLLVEYSVSA